MFTGDKKAWVCPFSLNQSFEFEIKNFCDFVIKQCNADFIIVVHFLAWLHPSKSEWVLLDFYTSFMFKSNHDDKECRFGITNALKS